MWNLSLAKAFELIRIPKIHPELAKESTRVFPLFIFDESARVLVTSFFLFRQSNIRLRF